MLPTKVRRLLNAINNAIDDYETNYTDRWKLIKVYITEYKVLSKSRTDLHYASGGPFPPPPPKKYKKIKICPFIYIYIYVSPSLKYLDIDL